MNVDPIGIGAITAPLSFDEPLAAGQQVFITSLTGAAAHRAL